MNRQKFNIILAFIALITLVIAFVFSFKIMTEIMIWDLNPNCYIDPYTGEPYEEIQTNVNQ